MSVPKELYDEGFLEEHVNDCWDDIWSEYYETDSCVRLHWFVFEYLGRYYKSTYGEDEWHGKHLPVDLMKIEIVEVEKQERVVTQTITEWVEKK